jgi:hypothetical protein
MMVDREIILNCSLCRCEKRGKRVKVSYKIEGGEGVHAANYWHDGDFLIHESGQAFRRIQHRPKPAP